MAEIDGELIYHELLVLDQNIAEVRAGLDEILTLLRLIRRESEEGRARIEATKARLGIDKLLLKAQSPQTFGWRDGGSDQRANVRIAEEDSFRRFGDEIRYS